MCISARCCADATGACSPLPHRKPGIRSRVARPRPCRLGDHSSGGTRGGATSWRDGHSARCGCRRCLGSGATGDAYPGSIFNGRGLCHRIGCDHTVAGLGVVRSCPSSSGTCGRRTHRQSGFALVSNFGVCRRSFLRELLDQYSRVRDGVGTVRSAIAENAHQRMRTTLRSAGR